VGTLIATNVNDNDVREISNRFRVELDQVRAWRPQYRKEGRPTYADFGNYIKGKHHADTFRLKYGYLEDLPKQKANRAEEEHKTSSSDDEPHHAQAAKDRAEARQRDQEEQQRQKERAEAPIDDSKYDDRYDEEWITPPQHPRKVKEGYVLVVQCPNGRTYNLAIPAGTTDGTRFCIKGVSFIRRPDGKHGNYWVQLTVPSFGETEPEPEPAKEEPKPNQHQRKKGR
jgi:hypothetical protein